MTLEGGRNCRVSGGEKTRARANEKFPSPIKRILSVGLKGIVVRMCLGGVALPFPFA